MKSPIRVVFCCHTNCDFKACKDGSVIRAIGNLHPKFPDEELYFKHCKMNEHPLGTCEYQTPLDRFPMVPRYMCKDDGS